MGPNYANAPDAELIGAGRADAFAVVYDRHAAAIYNSARAPALESSEPGAATQAWSAIDQQLTNQASWLARYNPRLNIATSSRLGNFQYRPFYGLLLDQLWVH